MKLFVFFCLSFVFVLIKIHCTYIYGLLYKSVVNIFICGDFFVYLHIKIWFVSISLACCVDFDLFIYCVCVLMIKHVQRIAIIGRAIKRFCHIEVHFLMCVWASICLCWDQFYDSKTPKSTQHNSCIIIIITLFLPAQLAIIILNCAKHYTKSPMTWNLN